MIPDPIYIDIGAIIRDRRKALRMTQEALSVKLGISRGALANIEAGRQNILVHQLYNYAAALGLSTTDLLPHQRRDPLPTGTERVPVPRNLNRSQAEQVARLIHGIVTDPQQPREVNRARKTKR